MCDLQAVCAGYAVYGGYAHKSMNSLSSAQQLVKSVSACAWGM